MRCSLIVVLLAVTSSLAQTTVYLPAPGAPTTYTVTGASATNPLSITVSGSAPANGTAVWVYGVNGNNCANGYYVVSNSSGSTFQPTWMYFGGTVNGTQGNCTGSYSGGGIVVILSPYTLTAHPRVWQDGPTGALTQTLLNSGTNGKANPNNPPFASINSSCTALESVYQNNDSDTQNYFRRFADCAYYWQATKNSTALTVARYGIDNFDQYGGLNGGDGFYCNTGGSQCSNRNNSSEIDYYSWNAVQVYNAFSILHGQLTSTEISNFAQKVLNDNDIYHDGIGGSATSPASACNNNNGNWQSGNCGLIFLVKHLTYAPVMAPGQESHYTNDYGSATQAGQEDLYPHVDNLTQAQLFGDVLAGLALCDDDPRACYLLTQSYTYWYRWYWTYATSMWTGLTQNGGRYTPYRAHPFNAELVEAVKNSTGLDLTNGFWLKRMLPMYIYMGIPDALSNQSFYTTGFDSPAGTADSPVNYYVALAATTYLYGSDSFTPYANYFAMNYLSPFYQANWMTAAAYNNIEPYLWLDPAATQSNFNSLGTQYLFADNDYSACAMAFGSSDCFPNWFYGAAVSLSDFTPSATQVYVAAAYNDNGADGDHGGCGTWGALHIYRQGNLMAGDGSFSHSGDQYNVGAGHMNCGQGELGTENLIELGGGDNWGNNTPVGIPRWAGPDPTGDANSRYMYVMTDLTNTYTASMHAARVQRHVLHLKKAGTQDYVISYDDVALNAASQIRSWWNFWTADSNSVTVNTSAQTVSDSNSNGGLATNFFGIGGQSVLVDTGASGNTHKTYTCPSSNGTSCNLSTNSFELISVNLPSTNNSPMPTISQPACAGVGGNCTAVEIQDPTSPKVVVFARQGALLSSVSFRTTHSGTAQYVIVGLQPGSYYITDTDTNQILNQNGTIALSADNTLYFEATSSGFSIAQTPFGIGVTPSSVTLSSTAPNGTFTVNVTAQTGFTGAVALSANGLPSDISGTFNPVSVSAPGTSTLTVTSNSNATPGTYPFTISGTNNGDIVSAPATVVFQSADFSLNPSPSSQEVTAGSNTQYTINVGSIAGFAAGVSLSVGGLPSGTSGSFSPSSVTAPGSSTLSITTQASAQGGAYDLTVTGKSGTLQHTVTPVLIVAVQAPGKPGNATLSVNPTSAAMASGSSTKFAVTITASSGTISAASFACSGLPTYATCQFATPVISSNGSSASSTLTLSTTQTALAPQKHEWMFASILNLSAVGLFGIVLVPGPRKRGLSTKALLVIAIAFCLVVMVGCGATSNTQNNSSSGNSQPATFSFNATGAAQINGTQMQASPVAINITMN